VLQSELDIVNHQLTMYSTLLARLGWYIRILPLLVDSLSRSLLLILQ